LSTLAKFNVAASRSFCDILRSEKIDSLYSI
jgi:hypothetical protein